MIKVALGQGANCTLRRDTSSRSTARSGLERLIPTIAGLGVLAMVLALSPGGAWAQDAVTEAGAAQQTGPDYPAGLDDPSIDLEQLQLRLIPLTLENLRPLAAAWQDHARAATQAAVDKSLEVRAAEGDGAEALRRERLSLLEQRGIIFEKFSAVVSSLEAKGGDPEEVAKLRTYLSAITKRETSWMTPQEFADSFMTWLVSPEGGVQIAFRIAVVVGSLFGLFIVARIVRSWARRMFNRVPSLSKLLRGFLVMVVYWLTIAFGLMIVLAALGVNITPFFALLGGASFIIAFALQDTLGNLASGLMIMINRPFDEGDYVQVAGLGGTVKHVSVVSTTVTTPDNQVIVIPNSKVWGDVITNVTASDTRRVDMVFGIGYGDSIEQAQKVLEDVVARHPLILDEPAPVIRVSELADSAVNFIVRPWAKTGDYWAVYWDLQRAVKEAFDNSGISIPFPQTDMHIHVAGSTGVTGPAALAALTGDTANSPPGATGYGKNDEGADTQDEGNERV
jgi:small conductance mechanosensitive channel